MPSSTLLSAIRFLYEYDARSTNHLLDVCAQIDTAAFTGELVKGQPSIRNVFAHMCSAEQWHLAGWKTIRGGAPTLPSHDDPAMFQNLSDIRRLCEGTRAEMVEF